MISKLPALIIWDWSKTLITDDIRINHIKPMPHIPYILSLCKKKNITQCILSNGDIRSIISGIRDLQWWYFKWINGYISTDFFETNKQLNSQIEYKPSAKGIHQAVEYFKCSINDVWMIGDSSSDQFAAKAADCEWKFPDEEFFSQFIDMLK